MSKNQNVSKNWLLSQNYVNFTNEGMITEN